MGSFTTDIRSLQSAELGKQDKEDAFGRILDRFWRRCPNIRLPDNLRRVSDDEDIRQEVAVLMWIALSTTPTPGDKGIWNALATAGQDEFSNLFCRFFAVVVKNRCASRTRSATREARHVRGASAVISPGESSRVVEAFGEVPDSNLLPELVVESQEEARRLSAALFGLPEDQQGVIFARYVLDLTLEETAASLGLTVAQVRYKMVKALDSLRGALRVADE